MSVFADGCKLEPYWWDHVPRPAIAATPVPRLVDVAVVGSGYTGLHAALQTARGGRRTIVFD
ncbi:MAG: FAD-binding protein, partial [Casimicrobiaceae bacterium]